MSDLPQHPVPASSGSEWTVETLRQRTDLRIAHVTALVEANDRRYEERYLAQKEMVATALTAAEKAVASALAAAEKAVTKAETAAEKRFEAVNEFRGTLGDQQRTLMPRPEAETKFGALDEKLLALQQRLDRSEGTKRGTFEGWGWAAAVVSLALAAWAAFGR